MKRIFIFSFILVLFCFSSCRIAFLIAASRSERVVVEKQEIGNYKLTLVRKIDWAGPWYYGYELKHKVCGIYLPKKYYWYTRDSLNNCLVRFERRTLVLDKCREVVVQK